MKPNLNSSPQLKTATPGLRTLFCRTLSRNGFLLTAFAFGLVALSRMAEGVTPAPDGGYPNWNTAEGQDALFSLTSGAYNTALGGQALYHNTTGTFNTATGLNALLANTTGSLNTATGVQALTSNTTGIWNTATGVNALFRNSTGNYNTAVGVQALLNNTTGFNNTANGTSALFSNSGGHDNTATGFQTLFRNTTGISNTAVGVNALYSNNTAGFNTAIGAQALKSNTVGSYNTATGAAALADNGLGIQNTAHGSTALQHNTNGSNNTAFGAFALHDNTSGGSPHNGGNTAIGAFALSSNTVGSDNIALGDHAGMNVTGNGNIDINNDGVAGESATIRIGWGQTRTFIAGIRGVTTGNGNAVPVVVDSAGQLGTVSSSRRFKKNIQLMDEASEAILSLKPVTFQYKSDKAATTQFGLIAEEVAAVNPNLVVRDENGRIYTVRYDAVNAMLLNEFLKEHRKFQELKANAARQQRQIDELTTGLRKVSTQREGKKRTRQVVLND